MDLLLPLAQQWVAGTTQEEGLARAREVNDRGMGAILNFLGEHYTERAEVAAAVWEYEAMAGTIQIRGLDACLSIKPTQFGLTIDEAYCRDRVGEILDLCRKKGLFLWFDMEGSGYTDATLDLYETCRARYGETGVALQANLRRTEGDLRRLLPEGVVRLCKGAYRETPTIAYQEKEAVDRSFSRLMGTLFQKGRRFALATHDDRLLRQGLALQAEYGRDLEFQMLLGVRDPLKAELAEAGHRVLEYIPYGPEWFAYFTRRLRERPRNVLLMIRSFLGP